MSLLIVKRRSVWKWLPGQVTGPPRLYQLLCLEGELAEPGLVLGGGAVDGEHPVKRGARGRDLDLDLGLDLALDLDLGLDMIFAWTEQRAG